MSITLEKFRYNNLAEPALDLFKQLGVGIDNNSIESRSIDKILFDVDITKEPYSLVKEAYLLGGTKNVINTASNKSIIIEDNDDDYNDIAIYALNLQREGNQLPTRNQLAVLSRMFNREFPIKTAILLLFKYSDGENEYISLSHTERRPSLRDNERDIPGKVTILRDINIENPHRGHLDILDSMRVPEKVKTFKDIYTHWQEAFDVNTLNKKFYKELLNWYFWAVRESKFPNSTILEGRNQPELAKVEKAKHIIRMITRLLFAWFIKEKQLVPEELFDTDELKKILTEFDANTGDNYYKAILQNLFFATLNCPITPTEGDERRRCFAESPNENFQGKSKDYALNYKMRYDDFFKDHNAFLEMMNAKVPFLNGGLFECLDAKENEDEIKQYVDNFTNHKTKRDALCVPNKLFFGSEVTIDFRQEYGVNTRREEKVHGIIPLLKKYKFTVAENTPIEEDVALDPELLGKVFENLLAQYNPETKDSARKESGSFYTPREVVNYMVDESLIAYLKNKLEWSAEEEEKLRQLFDNGDANPYSGEPEKARAIIQAISNCKILDPACGSGAFPMGALLRMVHVLGKLDPENEKWKAVQIQNATEQFQAAMTQEKKPEDREKRLEEIRKTFENNLLHADYIRKLFLIENCIFGVDIQDIAIQISKLRFFISLVIDQKSNNNAQDNFGILPLPNLETKLVAANTLIGVKEGSLEHRDMPAKREELAKIRKKYFTANTRAKKKALAKRDAEIRKEMLELVLGNLSNDTAEALAKWEPYDLNQNPASFFDPEWIFGTNTFDVVMGNPPYVSSRYVDFGADFKNYVKETYFSKLDKGIKSKGNQSGKINLFTLFIQKGLFLLSDCGVVMFIIPNNILRTTTYHSIRKYILENSRVEQIVDLGARVFDKVTASTVIIGMSNSNLRLPIRIISSIIELEKHKFQTHYVPQEQFLENKGCAFNIYMTAEMSRISEKISKDRPELGSFCTDIIAGIVCKTEMLFDEQNEGRVPIILGRDIAKFRIAPPVKYLDWDKKRIHRPRPDYLWQLPEKIVSQRVSGGTRPLICAVDTNFYHCFGSTNIITLKDKYKEQYYFFAALINSIVVNWFYANNFTNNSTLTVNINKQYLETVPVVNYCKDVDLLSRLLHYKYDELINLVLDAFIFNMYFDGDTENEGIDLRNKVTKDLNEIFKNINFTTIPNKHMANQYQSLIQRWSDTNSDVNKLVNLFKERANELLGE